MKISSKWLKMAKIYRFFGEDPFMTKLDFSEKSAQEMYEFESTGRGDISLNMFSNSFNGYAYGKKMLNLTVAMWKEDIENGLLFKFSLYDDPEFSHLHYWLDDVLNGVHPKDGLPGLWKFVI